MKIVAKKNIKRIVACFLAVMMLFVTACGSAPKEPGDDPVTGEKTDHLVVGFSIDSYLIERWQRDTDVFAAKLI